MVTGPPTRGESKLGRGLSTVLAAVARAMEGEKGHPKLLTLPQIRSIYNFITLLTVTFHNRGHHTGDGLPFITVL